MRAGWSLWSKDIILVIPPDSKTGTQAWVDAYHDAHDISRVASLPLKSGALQGALAIDYPREDHFDAVHIIYDGTNGQLPNLDLINSIVNIAGGQMQIHTGLQEMMHHRNNYIDRLQMMLRGMLKQGVGYAAGPHSSFIPYHVDAVTVQPYGSGGHDEMTMGRIVEGSFRSLNNLLEHLHQSFFFYLLMHRDRFVSIGTYLPSAMLLAANFTIMAIFLWVKSGQPTQDDKVDKEVSSSDKQKKDSAPVSPPTVERDLLLPLGVVSVCQAASGLPLFTLNHLPSAVSPLRAHCIRCYDLEAHMITDAVPGLCFLRPRFCRHAPGHIADSEHLLQPDTAALPAHQVLLPARPRHGPLNPCHAQLLPRVPRRPAREPTDLRPALPEPHCSVGLGRPSYHCCATDCCVYRDAALGHFYCRVLERVELRVERMGDVHPCGGVVHLVASMAGGYGERVWRSLSID